jgi:alpha-tubulin suppressor-like RCC1 family protein
MNLQLRHLCVGWAIVSLGLVFGCGALVGVDWDRVQAPGVDSGLGSQAQGGADGGLPFVPPPIPPHSDGTCDPDRKKCDNLCVSLLDARYGCDPHACGVCWVPHGSAVCANGKCSVGACETGWGACNPASGAACTTNVRTDPDNCGGCGKHCGPTEVCDNGTCGTTCSGDLTQCGRSCVDLDSDSANCDGCGNVCPADPNGTAVCDFGTCGVECTAPFISCGGKCVKEGIDTCGKDCTKCPTPPNGQPYCADGQCGVTCSLGLAACKGQCVPETVQQCGNTCTQCPAVNGTPKCSNGTCSITCNPGTTPCGSGCCEAARGLYVDRFRACATTSRGVKCWGNNEDGLLGNNSNVPRSALPVDVVGLGGDIDDLRFAPEHACALTHSGGVKCWGQNFDGDLGDGTYADRGAPVDAKLSVAATAIRLGQRLTCAILTGGAVKCWGYGLIVGDGSDGESPRPLPVDVVGLTSGVKAMTTGDFYACVVTGAGAVKCWGQQNSSEPVLGTGNISAYNEPTQVVGLTSGFVDVVGGFGNVCARKTDGSVLCWGANEDGEIGNGAATQAESTPKAPTALAPGNTWLAVGYQTLCAVGQGGAAQCWGQGDDGIVGDGTTTSGDVTTPAYVYGLTTGVQKVVVGLDHACAIKTGGALVCWGYNHHGQLGDGTTNDSAKPVNVLGLSSGVTAVGLGRYHTCALLQTGKVKCWGENVEGQLGIGGTSTADVPTPTDVAGF